MPEHEGRAVRPLTESVIATLKDTLFNKAILGKILADRLNECPRI
jgi:hypothetical protein